MRNVARVIRQRVLEQARYGGMTARQVCLEARQFSCWNRPRDEFHHHRHLLSTRHAKVAIELAQEVVNGTTEPSKIYFANHFLSKRLRRWPSWAHVGGSTKNSRLTPVHDDGYHLFFRLKPHRRTVNK